MEIAPLPENEAERLENLYSYDLLDTPLEPVFDDIASLAGKICGVPYALIMLVDAERQWIKAAYGWKGGRETTRDISFCSHAILHDEVFHVPDATADRRFSDNPLVTGEMAIRVYAGVPLVSEEGYKLGAVCVLSNQPTELSSWQIESLRQLSHVVSSLVKARKRDARMQLMARVLDQIPDEIMLADARSLRCVYANAAMQRTGASLGMNIREGTLDEVVAAAPGSTAQRLLDDVRSGRAARAVVELERPRANEGKAASQLEMRLQRLRFDKFDTIISVGHDIAERKHAEQVRQALQAELESRNRQLSRAYNQLSDELKVARDTQFNSLPPPRWIGAARFDWLFRASHYLSGDIFDYFNLNERYVCFHLIDVSGHGVSAALLALDVQRQLFSYRLEAFELLRRMDFNLGATAPRVVREFNRRFYRANQTGMYLTMVYGLLDLNTGEAALVQAGHPHPMVWHHDAASLQIVGNGGLPIGVLKNAGFEVLRLRLAPGSRLYLYSDGITEAENSYGVEFGAERLAQLLSREAGAPLTQIKSELEAALLEWNPDPAATKDDMSFLALEYGAAGPEQTHFQRASLP